MSTLTRLSVNMNAETAEVLRRVATGRGLSYTETVRRAISLLSFVETVQASGETIYVESADRTEIRKLIFP